MRHVLPMLQKPALGQPCNGCGRCCQLEVCGMALEAFGDIEAPCPALVAHDGRFWCAVIQQAEKINVAFAADLKWRLGIGEGCDAEIA